ncbi:hypothetical protein TB2_045085 [Malus domestica]
MENEIDIMVGTALVDIGLAMHRRGKLVLNMVHQMLEEAKPDELTFIALLSVCSHSGLFYQGRHYFYNLQALHGATPQIEHCACMVDLLSRAGGKQDKANLLRQDFMYKGLRKLPGISSVCIGGQFISSVQEICRTRKQWRAN